MIEIEVEGKKAYTHLSLVRPANQAPIQSCLEKQSRYTWYGLVPGALLGFKGSSLVPMLASKPPLQAAAVAIGAGLGYLVSSKVFGSYYQHRIREEMIEGDTPYWFDRHRTLNFDRIYYELADDHHYEPTLLFHGISERQLKGFFPDGVLTRGLKFDHESTKKDTHHH
jgi:hypothetical protein